MYRFGRFRVDPREHLVLRDGKPVPITPRVFATLVAFLRSPGRLLTKRELIATVWPDATVEEANLTVNVSTLRRLIDDVCIETVPRHGYRFVLPVEVDGDGPRDEPRISVRARELYARANQIADEADRWETARDLYQACVDEAPDFAPAWARLARCHRLIGKFTPLPAVRDHACAQAQLAFDVALALDPTLPLAHSLYTQLEVDTGRALDAVVRLLRFIERHGDDASVFGALVHAFRFCGLVEESRFAHERARELDPAIITSVAHTFWLLGDYEAALCETTGDIGYMAGLALTSLGRDEEAVAALRWRERDTRDNRARAFLVSLRAALEGDGEESRAALRRAEQKPSADPEALYYLGRTWARLDEHETALGLLERAVNEGFFCHPAFTRDPWLDALRTDPRFDRILEAAHTRHEAAKRAVDELQRSALAVSRQS